MNTNLDTIAAIATPIGSGAVGIIKISGPLAISSSFSIFHPKNKKIKSIKDIKSHKMYLGHIVNPINNNFIDEVLFVAMNGPYSYTGEDVVEINTHGGGIVLQTILEIILANNNNIRLAEPGEFTKRAFLKGRIDLTKAEAIIDIISSKTTKSLELASNQLSGNLLERVEFIRTSILKILSMIEAEIDFPEEVEMDNEEIFPQMQKIQNLLEELLNKYDQGRIFRQGARLVIVGRPNVGKSSLMNRLLEKQRSIVTAIPGTTRDIVEESINILGMPIILTDTAGIHETDDPVESIGINFTKERLSNADLVIFIIDASSQITEDDEKIFNQIQNKKTIIAINKIDLLKEEQDKIISFNDWPDTDDNWKISKIKISALYGTGIKNLKKTIYESLIGNITNSPDLAPNLRHKIALTKALKSINSAIDALDNNMEPDLIAIDIKLALGALGEIVGHTFTEDLLDEIFGRFCIGK